MNDKVYRFRATLERFPEKGGYHYFDFPHSVEKEYGTKGTYRVHVHIHGKKLDRALVPKGDGTHYIILGGAMRKELEVQLGDTFDVELRADPDQDHVNIPEELSAALDLEPGAWEKFGSLTVGKQRGICYWINSSKRVETRTKRALVMLERVMTGFYESMS